ncbi:MAG: sigma-70 family RNA polymerase sigma factor [Bacteroidota bacterium]
MSIKQTETYNLKHLSKQDFIAEIYNRYGKKLYAYAIQTWNLEEDSAWDLIYKTLYKVIDSYNNYTFDTEEKFASFIFKIFINYLRNHYRDNKHLVDFSVTGDIADAELMSNAVENDNSNSINLKLNLLNEELTKLEDWQRMLLLMRSEGKTYAEIATYMDKPEHQLKVYYQRLKEKISKRLYEHF